MPFHIRYLVFKISWFESQKNYVKRVTVYFYFYLFFNQGVSVVIRRMILRVFFNSHIRCKSPTNSYIFNIKRNKLLTSLILHILLKLHLIYGVSSISAKHNVYSFTLPIGTRLLKISRFDSLENFITRITKWLILFFFNFKSLFIYFLFLMGYIVYTWFSHFFKIFLQIICTFFIGIFFCYYQVSIVQFQL